MFSKSHVTALALLFLLETPKVVTSSNSTSAYMPREVHILVASDMTGRFNVWTLLSNVIRLALQDLEDQGVLPGFKIIPQFINSKCHVGEGIDVLYRAWYTAPAKPMILGPLCANVCTATAEIAPIWNVNQVSGTCVDPILSDKSRFPRFFRTASSDSSMTLTRLEILRHFRWRRVALFHATRGPFEETTRSMTRSIPGTDISVLITESIGTDPSQQITSLMKKDARIIIGGAYNMDLVVFFCEVYKLGFYGHHITWMLPGYYVPNWYELYPDTHDCRVEQILEAIQDVIYTDNSWKSLTNEMSFTGRTQVEVDDLLEQWERNSSAPSTSLPFIAASLYDATLAVGLSLNHTQTELSTRGLSRTVADFSYDDSEMADIITEGLRQVEFQGVKGYIKFNQFHDYEADGIMYQQKGAEKRYVGWHDKRINEIHWVNGGITWRGGHPPVDDTLVILKKLYVSRGLYLGLSTVAAIGISMTAGFLAFNTHFRGIRVIKMSSPNINTLILLGCMMSFASVFFENRESTESFGGLICSLKTGVFVVGFSLAFGGLFSKTWRVHMILTRASKTAKKTIISDTQLFLVVAGLVVIDMFIIVFWQVYDPYSLQLRNLTMTVNKEELYEESVTIYQVASCSSEYKTYFQGALFVIQGAMLAFAAFLAWETRKVKLAALNDSKEIGICIYNVAVLSIIGAAISMVISDKPDIEYGFTSAFLIVGTSTVSTVLFIPKIMAINNGEVQPSTESIIPKTRSTLGPGSTYTSGPEANVTKSTKTDA